MNKYRHQACSVSLNSSETWIGALGKAAHTQKHSECGAIQKDDKNKWGGQDYQRRGSKSGS